MQRKLEKAPESIVTGGRLAYGLFDRPPRNVNLNDAQLGGLFAIRALRAARLKEWLGYGIDSGDWNLTVFLQDSKFLCSANVYVNNRVTGECFKHMRGMPGRAVRISASHYNDFCRYKSKGFFVEIRNLLDQGRHEISVDVKESKSAPAISMELTILEDHSVIQPLVASFPLREGNHYIYTHKAPMPVGGTARAGGIHIALDPSRDLAIMDEHKSVFPYHTVWRWCTFAFHDSDGRIVGLNLGDHETNPNQAEHNENCIWFGPRISFLGEGSFELDKKEYMKPWLISEKNGRLDLTFTPVLDKLEHVNLGVAGIHYFQPYGRFNGWLADEDGSKIEVKDRFGVAEMMDTRF